MTVVIYYFIELALSIGTAAGLFLVFKSIKLI